MKHLVSLHSRHPEIEHIPHPDVCRAMEAASALAETNKKHEEMPVTG